MEGTYCVDVSRSTGFEGPEMGARPESCVGHSWSFGHTCGFVCTTANFSADSCRAALLNARVKTAPQAAHGLLGQAVRSWPAAVAIDRQQIVAGDVVLAGQPAEAAEPKASNACLGGRSLARRRRRPGRTRRGPRLAPRRGAHARAQI
jgi:hypothetical protein